MIRLKSKLSKQAQIVMAGARQLGMAFHHSRKTDIERLGERLNFEAAAEERMLTEQPLLKEYGKITDDIKKEAFEEVKEPKESNSGFASNQSGSGAKIAN